MTGEANRSWASPRPPGGIDTRNLLAPPAPLPPPPAARPLARLRDADKLAAFRAVYGGGAGACAEAEAARAERDALALFHATFGPARNRGWKAAGPARAPTDTPPTRLAFAETLVLGEVMDRPNRFTMRVKLAETGEVSGS